MRNCTSVFFILLICSFFNAKRIFSAVHTGQLKKKVTLSHVYNEVTSEPKITRYTTIVRKTLKVCL
jgi:hypothetical protein